VEADVRASVASLREALAEQTDVRHGFPVMFPAG
jgi:hypothetical protein